MLLNTEEPVTQGSFAGLVGLAQPQVAGLVAAGVLADSDTCGGWLRAYAKHLRDLAHGRAGSVAQARQRVLEAQAAALELRNRATAGDLLAADAVRRETARIGRVLAAELDSLAARVAPTLLGLDLHEIQAALDREQRALRLRALAMAEARANTPAGAAAAPLAPPAAAEGAA